ncbi:MAG: phosphoribosylformylglycinamidine synthase, partial [Candidatus Nephrothrix sp. EaCA]
MQKGDQIILLGGDNYRIGMGGAAVSSVATGQFQNTLELNAVQRANPEMQKRVMNAIRAAAEADRNKIISIHDHGAGGHLNCFSELLEETGGRLTLDNLPVGDPTLSDKEIISNESQERMGLAIRAKDKAFFQRLAAREQAPFYEAGEATGDHLLIFENKKKKILPVNVKMKHLFGSSPLFVIRDEKKDFRFEPLKYDVRRFEFYLEQILQLESVACKDWLTNKVDRSVTGRVAMQQACGPLQLPLNNVGIMALDFSGTKG